jgi:hypothetical protein
MDPLFTRPILVAQQDQLVRMSRALTSPDEQAAVATLWRALADRLRNTLPLAATKALRSRELIPTVHTSAVVRCVCSYSIKSYSDGLQEPRGSPLILKELALANVPVLLV